MITSQIVIDLLPVESSKVPSLNPGCFQHCNDYYTNGAEWYLPVVPIWAGIVETTLIISGLMGVEGVCVGGGGGGGGWMGCGGDESYTGKVKMTF